jgi:DNA polymerase-3 subunit epsilon
MLDLKLERPLIIFDLETTGTVIARDRIVEISVVKILPDGARSVKTRRLNPEMPIPAQATEIHGISDADVVNEPTFKSVSKNLLSLFEGCDLGGYNALKFDVPILINEFNRAGLEFSIEGRRIIDAYSIFCKLYPRTLSGAYKFFCGKDLEGAHGAEADTLATVEIFEAQLARHPELPRSLDQLHQFSDNSNPDSVDSSGRFKWSGDEVIVCFGKNSGTTLKKLAVDDPGFLKWIIRVDFPEDVKDIARSALIGKFPVKKSYEKED